MSLGQSLGYLGPKAPSYCTWRKGRLPPPPAPHGCRTSRPSALVGSLPLKGPPGSRPGERSLRGEGESVLLASHGCLGRPDACLQPTQPSVLTTHPPRPLTLVCGTPGPQARMPCLGQKGLPAELPASAQTQLVVPTPPPPGPLQLAFPPPGTPFLLLPTWRFSAGPEDLLPAQAQPPAPAWGDDPEGPCLWPRLPSLPYAPGGQGHICFPFGSWVLPELGPPPAG